MSAPLSVLLADDEDGIRNMFALLLKDKGHRVRTAPGGDEALRLFRDEKPDVLITDVNMPGMDGITLLKAVKALDADAEVIILTGHADMELAVAGLRHGAGDFLSKPVSDEALDVALERARLRLEIQKTLRRHTEELEELVRQRTAELIESERFAAVGESAASIAHAVKNIAGTLEGTLYVLDKGLELDKREYLEQGQAFLRREVMRLRDLAVELLHLGRPKPVNPQPEDPERPAREVLELASERARENGVGLEADFSAGQAPFPLDAEAVHECLLNLVLNAVEALKETGRTDGRVRLAVTREKRDGGECVVYRVEDNGPGLPEEGAAGSFGSLKSGGSGIGLFATRKRAREMGADFSLESAPGKGVTAALTLRQGQAAEPLQRQNALDKS